MKKIFLVIVFLLSTSLAQAQITTCVIALAAKPQGPFPCSVTATWQDNSTDESGFLLERRLNGGGWTTVGGGPLAANVTSVVDATLTQSTTVDNVYDYRVTAINQAGSSAPSNVASFTVTKAISIAKPPSNLVISFEGATGQIKLSNKNTINLKNQSGTMTLTGAISVIDLQ